MSGIGNYFHGESGEVEDVFYVADPERLFFDVALRGDPHRHYATDYGSDIGIDPSIRPGHRVVYVRLDNTSGLWVREGDEHTPRLEQALARCHTHRRRAIEPYRQHVMDRQPGSWPLLESLSRGTGIRVREAGQQAITGPDGDRPHTPLSLFLSYARDNVMRAREMADYLETEAKLDVWLDLAQPQRPSTTDEELTSWLQQAVHEARLFLVLLTRSALKSKWVEHETRWAVERKNQQADLKLMFLNLEDLDLPAPPFGWMLACRTLAIGEILEEIYARIYELSSRRDWVAEEMRRGGNVRANRPFDYRHAEGEAGKAVDLSSRWKGSELHWTLTYEKDGQRKTAEGHGREIVDFGIRPGDRIAFFIFQNGFPLWMRSDDLTITPVHVAREYSRIVSSPRKG